MNECEKYIEAISAYFDGELDGFEKAELEAHLETCENCRSYLEAIKAISDADAQEEPVPDMLRVNVMGRIAKQKKQRNTGKIMRYLGLCACIAIVILVAPRLPNLGCGASAPKATEECIPAGEPMEDAAAAEECAPAEPMMEAKAAEAAKPAEEPAAEPAPEEECAEVTDEIQAYTYVAGMSEEFSAIFWIPQREKSKLDGLETRILDGQTVYIVETEKAFEMFDSEYAEIFDITREYAAVILEK